VGCSAYNLQPLAFVITIARHRTDKRCELIVALEVFVRVCQEKLETKKRKEGPCWNYVTIAFILALAPSRPSVSAAEPVKVGFHRDPCSRLVKTQAIGRAELSALVEKYWQGAQLIALPVHCGASHCNDDGSMRFGSWMGKVNSSASMQPFLLHPHTSISQKPITCLSRCCCDALIARQQSRTCKLGKPWLFDYDLRPSLAPDGRYLPTAPVFIRKGYEAYRLFR